MTDFIKGSLSDSNGTPSFARIACAILIYALLNWETYLISKSGIWIDIPANWMVLVLAVWGIGKGAETVQAKFSSTTQIAKGVTDAIPTGSTGSVNVQVGDGKIPPVE